MHVSVFDFRRFYFYRSRALADRVRRLIVRARRALSARDPAGTLLGLTCRVVTKLAVERPQDSAGLALVSVVTPDAAA